MSEESTHLLTQMGVLTSFSMSVKFTEKEMEEISEKLSSKKISEDRIAVLLKEKIMGDIIKASQSGNLPGFIQKSNSPIPNKNIETLNQMGDIITSKLKTKKLDKLSLCYFINYLVNRLELTEEDFECFHRKVSETPENNSDE